MEIKPIAPISKTILKLAKKHVYLIDVATGAETPHNSVKEAWEHKTKIERGIVV